MIASKKELYNFTAGYLAERLGYERPIAEDLAQDFVNDDFPANRIRTIPEATNYLAELLQRVRPAAPKGDR